MTKTGNTSGRADRVARTEPEPDHQHCGEAASLSKGGRSQWDQAFGELPLGSLLGKAFQLMRQAFMRMLQEEGYDLTPEQWVVLKTVGLNPGITPSEVADHILRDRTSITRILDRLASKRLLTRRRCGVDRRSQKLWLTAAGQGLHEELVPLVKRFNDRFFGVCSPEQLAALREILTTISARNE